MNPTRVFTLSFDHNSNEKFMIEVITSNFIYSTQVNFPHNHSCTGVSIMLTYWKSLRGQIRRLFSTVQINGRAERSGATHPTAATSTRYSTYNNLYRQAVVIAVSELPVVFTDFSSSVGSQTSVVNRSPHHKQGVGLMSRGGSLPGGGNRKLSTN